MTTSTPALPLVITPASGTAPTSAPRRGAEPSGGGAVPFEQALEQACARLEGTEPESGPADGAVGPGSGDGTETAVVPIEGTPGVVPASPLPAEVVMSSSVPPAEAEVAPQPAPSALGAALPGAASGRRTGEAATSGAAQTPTADLDAAPRVPAGVNGHVAQGTATQPITPVAPEGTSSTAPKDGLGTPPLAQSVSQSQSTAAEPFAPAAVPSVQAATTTPAPVVAGPAPEMRPAVQHPLLHEQIAPRLVGIRSLGDGTHRMTLRVEPEAIGPLRIVAEIRGDHVRVELMAVGEVGREALRSAIPELRRELAAAGMQAQLDLASGGRGSDGDAGRSSGDELGNGGRQTDVRDGVHVQEAEPVSRLIGEVPAGRIDVLA